MRIWKVTVVIVVVDFFVGWFLFERRAVHRVLWKVTVVIVVVDFLLVGSCLNVLCGVIAFKQA